MAKITSISTKRTIISYINSLNAQKTTNYDVGSQCHGLGKAQKRSWISFNHDFLHRGLLLKPRVSSAYIEVITLKVLRSSSMFGLQFRNICITNDHRYVPFVVITNRSFPNSWLITGFATRVTRQVSLMEQEVLILPEHLSASYVLSEVRVYSSYNSIVFVVSSCNIIEHLKQYIVWYTHQIRTQYVKYLDNNRNRKPSRPL